MENCLTNPLQPMLRTCASALLLPADYADRVAVVSSLGRWRKPTRYSWRAAFFFLVCSLLPSVASAQPARAGLATYYTTHSCQREGTSGVYTANGEPFIESAFTCALPSHHFGGYYRVCRADDASRCVVVRHNDYGPGRGPRQHGVVIDLTPAAYDRLANLRSGRVAVIVSELAR